MAAALAGASATPLALLVLSVLPRRPPLPGARLRLAALAGAILWLAATGLAALAGTPASGADLVAGAAMQLAAAIVCFILWSLVVWGFTINMLLTLAAAKRPVSLDEWAVLYAGGRGLAEIGENRAGVLLGAGLAVRGKDGAYALTRAGRVAAPAFRALRGLFGVG
jgi:hypothetical protein